MHSHQPLGRGTQPIAPTLSRSDRYFGGPTRVSQLLDSFDDKSARFANSKRAQPSGQAQKHNDREQCSSASPPQSPASLKAGACANGCAKNESDSMDGIKIVTSFNDQRPSLSTQYHDQKNHSSIADVKRPDGLFSWIKPGFHSSVGHPEATCSASAIIHSGGRLHYSRATSRIPRIGPCLNLIEQVHGYCDRWDCYYYSGEPWIPWEERFPEELASLPSLLPVIGNLWQPTQDGEKQSVPKKTPKKVKGITGRHDAGVARCECGALRHKCGSKKHHELPYGEEVALTVNGIQAADTAESYQDPFVENKRGCVLLNVWKNTAGRSKSWRRCRKATDPRTRGDHRLPAARMHAKMRLLKSALWLPANFIRYPRNADHLTPKRVVRVRSTNCPTKTTTLKGRIHTYEDDRIEALGRYSAEDVLILQNKLAGPSFEAGNDEFAEPGTPFIRLIWTGDMASGTIGHMDRFLPPGLILRSRWQIQGLYRNESHADVLSICPDQCELVHQFEREAYVFLEEYHLSSEIYAKRQKTRMRSSGNCLDVFWYGGRHVYVMKVVGKGHEFRLRITEGDFPSLVSRDKCLASLERQRRDFKGKPTFAAVAGSKPPGLMTAPHSRGCLFEQNVLQSELEKMKKVQVKKKEKQKCRRQRARLARKDGTFTPGDP